MSAFSESWEEVMSRTPARSSTARRSRDRK